MFGHRMNVDKFVKSLQPSAPKSNHWLLWQGLLVDSRFSVLGDKDDTGGPFPFRLEILDVFDVLRTDPNNANTVIHTNSVSRTIPTDEAERIEAGHRPTIFMKNIAGNR